MALQLTREEIQAVEEAAYYAKWGIDGFGTPGPKPKYVPKPEQPSYPSAHWNLESARHHKRGNGWKANHQN